MMKRWSRWSLSSAVILAVGCSALPGRQVSVAPAAPEATAQSWDPARYVLYGNVQDIRGLSSQNQLTDAQLGSLASQATISLIDISSSQPVGSGLSDSSGGFTVTFQGGNAPPLNQLYYLEASKATSPNPGSPILRLRTIVQWDGTGWKSISSSAVGGPLVINQLTTALTILVGQGRITGADAIGKVTVTSSSVALNSASVGGVLAAEIQSIAAAVKAYLLAGMEPIGNFPSSSGVTITGITPTSGGPGTLVTINGTGFASYPGGTVVRFGGASAPPQTPISVKDNQVTVLVPTVAASGKLRVESLGKFAETDFQVPPGVNVNITDIKRFPLNASLPVKYDEYCKIEGFGFTTAANLSKNEVYFPLLDKSTGKAFPLSSGKLATASVATYDATLSGSRALYLKVPANATSGPVYLKNPNGLSDPFPLVMVDNSVTIAEVYPRSVASHGYLQIKGDKFGTALGQVFIGNKAAMVQYWTNSTIRVVVPPGVGANNATAVSVRLATGAQADATVKTIDGNLENSNWAYVSGSHGGGNMNAGFWSGKRFYILPAEQNTVYYFDLNNEGGPASGLQFAGNYGWRLLQQDMAGTFDNWVGKRFYVFQDQGTSVAGYLSFDIEGTAGGAWGQWNGHNRDDINWTASELSSVGSGRGVYGMGGYAGTPFFYKTYNPATDTYSGGWTTGPTIGNAETPILFIANRLWWLTYNYTSYINLNSDGTPAGGWNNTGGGAFCGNYGACAFAAGQYVYMLGPWCGGSEVRRTPVTAAGNAPQAASGCWPYYGNANVNFGGGGTTVTCGRYVYKIGGWCGNTNAVQFTTMN
ncbi:MAG: IPT/TIG domain-containing protein [Candidatus Sericytochromatia bacterium]|nr:IPT/TIG domain-containing protein [Candidatus Sericytochromatia bacterium]